jgi:predicted DNA binding CopG/RHH family protein
MKKKNLKSIPNFRNEDEERDFWAKKDSSDYIDWSKAIVNPLFSNLKPTMTTISIRLPQHLLNEIKVKANQIDVPYQSLMKMYLAEKLEELRKKKIKSHKNHLTRSLKQKV